jgi:DNA polymerase/3'-5' exonuclease PolX
MEKKLDFMLAKEYSVGMKRPRKLPDYNPPIGWLMSEKFDGYRARWDPERNLFISRQNKPTFPAPQWFKSALPEIALDGELFMGRDGFQRMGAARRKEPIDEDWFDIKYYVYDAPDIEATFEQRYNFLRSIMPKVKEHWIKFRATLEPKFKKVTCPIVLTKQTVVTNMDQMKEYYEKIIEDGAEGIMLKDPSSIYEDKRSNFMLKYKPSFDAEAVIVDYRPGTGKYTGKLGAFICKPLINKGNYQVVDEDKNHIFAISGMDDNIRENYKKSHPVGTIITYEYSGMTDAGKPRFARYIRIRDDVEVKKEKVLENQVISNEILKRIELIFKKLESYEKINGEHFKAAAYRKANLALSQLDNDSQLIPKDLKEMKGIGEKILEKINQIIQTGTCPMYEKVKDIVDPRKLFLDIHGVGTVKANELVKKGYKTIDDLIKDKDKVLNNVQLKGLKYYDDILQRIPREEIVEHEKILKSVLKSIDPTAELTIAGSFRRMKPDSGDIDVLINTPSVKNNSIYNKFIDELVNNGYLVDELSRGNKKYMGLSILDKINRRVDFMFTKPDEYPFAILYFTGSAEFNVRMREDLLKRGLTLNEYSLKDSKTKKKVDHKFNNEKDIFDYIKYDYIEPQNR